MWTSMPRWLGSPLDRMDATAGIAQMTQAWLRAFGPGTANDLKWWGWACGRPTSNVP